MKLRGWMARPATLGALLGLSVAANLFLGGVVAGHFGASRMTPPPLFAPGTDTLFRLLPDRERRAIREHLHAQHPEVMDAHLRLRRIHREIVQELANDAPDRKRLEHKLHEVREDVELLEKSMHVAFLDTVLKLPTHDRRQLLNEMRRRPLRRVPPPPGPDSGSAAGAADAGSPPPPLPPEDDSTPDA